MFTDIKNAFFMKYLFPIFVVACHALLRQVVAMKNITLLYSPQEKITL